MQSEERTGLRGNVWVHRTTTLSTWKQLVECEDSFGKTWMFRGQGGDWPLESTLHRVCRRFSRGFDQARDIEKALMRDFARQYSGTDAHLVTADPMYCMAKMQHYRAPTRLLDWSYSFFVALFFAMESASVGQSVYIWAMNYEWTRTWSAKLGITNWAWRNADATRSRADLFEAEFFKPDHRMVFTEGAVGLNSRLADQQGVFLLPGRVDETIDDIMDAQLQEADVLRLIRLQFNAVEFEKVISKLHRMKLTHSAMYGDAESLGRDLAHKIPALSIRVERITSGQLKE